MRIDVKMPKVGYDMETGRIVSWSKRVGDHVDRGEVIAEIETDKAVVEFESLAAGTLAEIVHAEGAEVAVGSTIARLEG